ncbi:MAG TPA: hypothetical protein ENK28_11505 [Aliiroseovarius sp.]|nr:hypothetical protein [Aliiroseovarius sp.]
MVILVGIVVLAGFSVMFAFAFYDRYFRWRDCFNDLGRCFDSDTGLVYLEQAGMVWMGLFVLALLGLVALVRLKMRNRR